MDYTNKVFSLTKKALGGYESIEAKNIGKLAYLSLTGKPEGPIRDRVAWLFQKEFDQNGESLISAREYKRYDLAILQLSEQPGGNEHQVKHIFEFKVGSAANFRERNKKFNQGNKYVKRVISDFQKGSTKSALEKITSVFIAVEPLEKIPENEKPFIKYAGRSNALRKKYDEDDFNMNFLHQNIIDYFEEEDKLDIKKTAVIELEPYNGKNVRLHLLILSAKEDSFPLRSN